MKVILIICGIILALVLFASFIIYRQNQVVKLDLGLDDGQLKEIPETPNCVSTQTSQKDKQVDPMPFKASLKETKKTLKEALIEYGNIEIIREEEDYIYAVATTLGLKFHDDIEIYFDSANQVIQYRSASRAGHSDMGLNRARYEALVQYYKKG